MNLKNKKGFTLIEVMLTLAIMGMISLIIYSLVGMSSKPHAIISNEFAFQANVRLASEKLTETIKKSTAIFTYKKIEPIFTSDIFPETRSSADKVVIDEAFINSSSKKQELLLAMEKYNGWSFITLNEDGTEFREFLYQRNPGEEKGFYTLRRILEKQKIGKADIQYEITYQKHNPYHEDNLLEYTLVAKVLDPAVKIEPVEIKSEVEALNSLQIIDKGDYRESAKVIFFRTEDRPVGTEAEAAVAMVLDISGSMRDDVDGNSRDVSEDPSQPNASRISIMRAKANDLIDKMASSGDEQMKTKVNLIPFSNTSNLPSVWSNYKYNGATKNPKVWKDANQDQGELKDLIGMLEATNGTNVGDGIRRAYYRFEDYGNNDIGKYMILLMDGVPTFGSVHRVNNNTIGFNDRKGPNPKIEEKLIHNGYEYFYVNHRDNYSGWFGWGVYEDTDYTYRRFSNIEFVTNDIDIRESTISRYNERYTDGRYAGQGNKSDLYLSKGYITEMAKKLGDLKNSAGEKNVKVFVIGFSNVPEEKAELEFIKTELAKYTQQVYKYEANDADALENIFNSINQIILDDLWHILGPKE